jgi:hypothetical protein
MLDGKVVFSRRKPCVQCRIIPYRGLEIPKFFRGDAAFADPKLLTLLEDARKAVVG